MALAHEVAKEFVQLVEAGKISSVQAESFAAGAIQGVGLVAAKGVVGPDEARADLESLRRLVRSAKARGYAGMKDWARGSAPDRDPAVPEWLNYALYGWYIERNYARMEEDAWQPVCPEEYFDSEEYQQDLLRYQREQR